MFNAKARSLLASSLRANPAARNPFSCLPSRTIITLKDVKFTAHATARGPGRSGTVSSNNINLKLAVPKELGSGGRGHNPEQLFAMAHAASLLSEIQATARRLGTKKLAKKAIVRTSVHIGTPQNLEGYGLAVDITVGGTQEEFLKTGHELCPYSRALAHGARVNVYLVTENKLDNKPENKPEK